MLYYIISYNISYYIILYYIILYYIILSFVACLAVPFISTLCRKLHDVLEKVIERKMCVLIFSTTLSETFLMRGRTQRDIVINVHRSYVKYQLVLSDFIYKLEFSPKIFENTQI